MTDSDRVVLTRLEVAAAGAATDDAEHGGCGCDFHRHVPALMMMILCHLTSFPWTYTVYRKSNVRNRQYVAGMSEFMIKALTPETFGDFAALVERNGGMFAGCWCTKVHPDCAEKVEGYPHDTGGVRKKNSSFLYNGTRTMYEREGFSYDRPKGLGTCVMVREVAPSTRS